MPSSKTLAEWVTDAGRRTLDLIADLGDDQLLGPELDIVNPLLWEIGHLTWFYEKWVLRHENGKPSVRADADALYDSSAVEHSTRWDLPLPSRTATLEYMSQVRERVLDVIHRGPDRSAAYFVMLSVFHEDMHDEAFMYTRQTLGYPRPNLNWGQGSRDRNQRSEVRDQKSGVRDQGSGIRGQELKGSSLSGDVEIPGGVFSLGSRPDGPFVFDNEKWAHPVELAPFAIARTPVTQADFAAFVEADGYHRREFWTEAGWRWREGAQADRPTYWRREGNAWLRRDFDRWVPMEPDRPVIHVNWYEADAYCRWAGRRLLTEAEWEAAASAGSDNLTASKRRFPWGGGPASFPRAQLDGFALGCCDVAELPDGDSYFGCRQMIGNVWEWTASDFLPYPGFVADPYRDYSQPWFGTHKVLRGGAWTTRGRLLSNTWRNFYQPNRRDIFAGFRTCRLEA
jgi:iron(II)-dependent oxidoreductase